MNIEDLKVGDRIALKVELSSGKLSTVTFSSKIEEIQANNDFIISAPNVEELDKWVGRNIQLIVVGDITVYTCQAKVLNIVSDQSVDLMKIKILSMFVKEQRRAFFRLELILDVFTNEYGNVKTINISGNGMAIMMHKIVPNNTILSGSIDLGGEMILFKGKVIRFERMDNKGNLECFLIGVAFINMLSQTREKIHKYIHFQQIVLRKRSLEVMTLEQDWDV